MSDRNRGVVYIKPGEVEIQGFFTGQTRAQIQPPAFMQAILNDRKPIAKIVNATVIKLEEAPQSYEDFDKGVATKFVIDPHGMITKKAA